MKYDIRIEQFPSRPIAVVRRQAKLHELSKVIPEACGLVWNTLRDQQIRGGRLLAIYWDDVFNVDIGAELDSPFSGHGEVVGAAMPSGTVATATHYGPYANLPNIYNAIRQWCNDHHRAISGPCWEIYDHWRDEWNNDPAKIRTDVYFLLQNSA